MKIPGFVRLAGALAAIACMAGVAAATKSETAYTDARASIEAHRAELPAELASLDDAGLQAAWPGWVARRNAGIRARLAQGDEDSVVNLWLYGTSFTRRPRVTDREAAQLGGRQAVQELLLARLDDFVSALAKRGLGERLQFARDLIA